MSILSGNFINNTLSLKCSSFSSSSSSSSLKKPSCFCIPYKPSRLSSVNSQHPAVEAAAIFKLKKKPICRILMAPSAAAEAVTIDTQTEDSDSVASKPPDLPQEAIQEVKEVVKATGKQILKPRLVLKFIWMEKNIGLGLDQLLPGYGTVPLSPYFFWPRKDAWEELKAVLESKPSISQKKMIILLNQATDIINLWQQSGGNLS